MRDIASGRRSRPRVRSLVLAVVLAGVVPPLSATASGAAALATQGGSLVGDGFFPVTYINTGRHGGVEVWVIRHHATLPQAEAKVSCFDETTGALCDDVAGRPTTWPKPLNTAPWPLGNGDTGDLATTQLPEDVFDPSLHGVMYYPAVTTAPLPGFPGGAIGAGCLNLQAQANCPFTPLAPLTDIAGTSNINGLTGFVSFGGNLYGVATTGQEICFSMTTHTACPGQPYAASTPPSNDAAGLGPADYLGTQALIAGKIYITSNTGAGGTTASHGPVLACFDPAARASCAGWAPKTLPAGPHTIAADAVYADYDTTGSPVGVCATVGANSGDAPAVTCYDFVGDPLAPPASLALLYPRGGTNSLAFNPLTITVGGDLRSYFPFFSTAGPYPGDTLCYDWSIQAVCAGFAYPDGHPDVNRGITEDYGYAYDGHCLYGSGDEGYLFSIDPVTGGSPCTIAPAGQHQ